MKSLWDATKKAQEALQTKETLEVELKDVISQLEGTRGLLESTRRGRDHAEKALEDHREELARVMEVVEEEREKRGEAERNQKSIQSEMERREAMGMERIIKLEARCELTEVAIERAERRIREERESLPAHHKRMLDLERGYFSFNNFLVS